MRSNVVVAKGQEEPTQRIHDPSGETAVDEKLQAVGGAAKALSEQRVAVGGAIPRSCGWV
jgi:hypothetical protein